MHVCVHACAVCIFLSVSACLFVFVSQCVSFFNIVATKGLVGKKEGLAGKG